MRWLREKRRYGVELCVEGYTRWKRIEETPFAPLAPQRSTGRSLGDQIAWAAIGAGAVFSVALAGALIARSGVGCSDRDAPSEVARRERFQDELQTLRNVRAAKRAATRQREHDLSTSMVVKAAIVEETCSGPGTASIRRKVEAQGLRYSDIGCRRLAARCADSGMAAYRAVVAGCPAGADCVEQAADASGSAFEQCFITGVAELIE